MRIWWKNCRSWARKSARSGNSALRQGEGHPDNATKGSVAVDLNPAAVVLDDLADDG
jgi:hypothetical protein